MRTRPGISLRLRLLLLVAAVLLPVLALITWIGLEQRGRDVERALALVHQVAGRCALDHRGRIDHARELLGALVLLPAFRQRQGGEAAVLLRALGERHQGYALLLAVDPAGRSWAHSLPGEGTVDVADRPYFRAALDHRRFTVGEYTIGRLSGRPSLHCALPIEDGSGGLAGVVVAAIDLAWMQNASGTEGLPPGSVLTLLDRHGTIIARSLDPERWVGRMVPIESRAQTVVQPEGGIFPQAGPDGIERYYWHLPLVGSDTEAGRVMVGVPMSAVVADADRALLRNLALVLGVGALALAASWQLGQRWVLDPVQRLAATSDRLAAGDLGARAAVAAGPGELAALGASIDRMAAALQAREAERATAVADLARAHGLLQAVVDAAPVAVITLDRSGRVAGVWNGGAERLLGWSAAEAVAWEGPLAAQVPCLAEPIREALAGKVVEGREVALGQRRGTELRCMAHAAPLSDPVGALLVLVDVSAAHRAAEQLQRAQKVDLVGRLAAGIAHDFNNLLAVMVGYAEVLAHRCSDSAQRTQAQEILHAADRARALTARLLAFGRRQVVQPREIDLAEAIRDAARLVEPALGVRIRLQLDLAERCPVTVDPVEVEQVVANLLLNARDAMPGGGVVRLALARIPAVEGEWAELTVRDQGCGMDRTVQARLFEPFFTTKPAGQGTGLGLATVRAIVLERGGEVEVESEPGVGTCLRVRLPIGKSQRATSQRLAAQLAGRPNILVADAEAGSREQLVGVLEEAGCQVRGASDLADALSLSGSPPRMLVCELSRLGREGVGLAGGLRERHPGLPVLFIASSADPDLAQAVRGFGPATSFLHRPFTPKELIRAVLSLLASVAEQPGGELSRGG